MARPPDDQLIHFLQTQNQPLTHLSPGGTYHPHPLPLDAEDVAAIAKRKQLYQWAQGYNQRPMPAAPTGPVPMPGFDSNTQAGALASAMRLLK